jgi:hypothetical protein
MKSDSTSGGAEGGDADGALFDVAEEPGPDVANDASLDAPADGAATFFDAAVEAPVDVSTADAGQDSAVDVATIQVTPDATAPKEDAPADAEVVAEVDADAAIDAEVDADAEIDAKALADAEDSASMDADANSDAGSDASPLPDFTPPSGCGLMSPGQGLAAGQSFSSCDGRFTLKMQTDGNLVFYAGSTPLWNSQTDGKGGAAAIMQTDGNFVLYDAGDNPLWWSKTNGTPGAYLELQNDGNLVVYAPGAPGATPIWYSGTSQLPPAPSGCGVVQAPQGLVDGQSFLSCDGRFTLKMQTDGNLVLYEGATALWSSQTSGTRGWEAIMQADGDFVLYDFWTRLWHSATGGNPGSYLKVQTDGNLVVYSPSNVALWNAGTCCH